MNLRILVAALFLSVSIFPSVKGQNPQPFHSLIANQWHLVYIIEDGERKVPDLGQQEDLMIFTTDQKAVTIDECNVQTATWEYDPNKNILLFTHDETKETDELHVQLLKEDHLVLVYKNSLGKEIEVHMKPKNRLSYN